MSPSALQCPLHRPVPPRAKHQDTQPSLRRTKLFRHVVGDVLVFMRALALALSFGQLLQVSGKRDSGLDVLLLLGQLYAHGRSASHGIRWSTILFGRIPGSGVRRAPRPARGRAAGDRPLSGASAPRTNGATNGAGLELFSTIGLTAPTAPLLPALRWTRIPQKQFEPGTLISGWRCLAPVCCLSCRAPTQAYSALAAVQVSRMTVQRKHPSRLGAGQITPLLISIHRLKCIAKC